jgi:hypothetical protein
MATPDRDPLETHEHDHRPQEPLRYPTNHVVGVLNASDQLRSAVEALERAGFRAPDIKVASGAAMAAALESETGRSGVFDLAVRIAERIGLADDEMALKDRYERALRDGRFVIAVATPTDEHKQAAALTLREHGGTSINLLGRFTIEAMRD